MFDKITALIETSKLTLRQRHNLLLSIVVFFLGSVILYQNDSHFEHVKECKRDKTQMRKEFDERTQFMQDRIDEEKTDKLRYFQEMSQDYYKILIELSKIQSQSDE